MTCPFAVNYLAVLAAAVASMVIGSLWYSPLLFGKPWMALSGWTPEKMDEAKKKGMAKTYLAMFVALLFTNYVLAGLIQGLDWPSRWAGAQVGVLAWLGFVGPVLLGSVLWDGKPLKLYLINAGHYLVALTVSGMILGMWR